MAKYHGKKGQVFISTSGSGVAALVGSLSSWSLDMETDTAEVSAFGDTNKTFVQGLKGLEFSFEGFYDDAQAAIWTAVDSTDGSRVYLYPSSDAPSKYAYGTAWLAASIETDIGGPVTISATGVAKESWGIRF